MAEKKGMNSLAGLTYDDLRKDFSAPTPDSAAGKFLQSLQDYQKNSPTRDRLLSEISQRPTLLEIEPLQNAVKTYLENKTASAMPLRRAEKSLSDTLTAHPEKSLQLKIDGLCEREIGKAAFELIRGDLSRLDEVQKTLAEMGYQLDEKRLQGVANHQIVIKEAFAKAVSKTPEKNPSPQRQLNLQR